MIKLEDNHPGQEVAIEPNDVITNEVMPKLLAADMVVLVSSLYYYGINAALKAVIDRFYNYNHELHGGKKAITLVSGYLLIAQKFLDDGDFLLIQQSSS